ncbi:MULTISPECIES: TolC family outer membrane protein [unclassified Oleiphilus]|nr:MULTISPECIES: TolC family outer membrane protein [unclassified Oleiphilus]
MISIKKLVLCIAISCLASVGSALADTYDLVELYQSALTYDADIAAAESAYVAEQEQENIALANLLPQIDADASIGHTNDEIKKGPNVSDSYKSTTYGVSLTQPLFNMPRWYDLSASEYGSSRAEAEFLTAQQNLILKVSEAYFNVLRAEEDLIASQALETAVKRQYEQAKEQFEVGLIAITDVHEAKASYDSSQTTRIRAEGALTIARETLSRITGQYAIDLKTLSDTYETTIDPTDSIESWVNSAIENNPSVIAAHFNAKALEMGYKSKRAVHYPTLTLTAGFDNTNLDEVKSGIFNNNVETEAERGTVFINLNLPIYAGGGTSAASKRARLLSEQAMHQLTAAQRSAEIETRSEFINLRTNSQTVDSLKQNIISRESALEATREGYNVGTRNIVEVLDAERNYFTALRDYASARFDFIISSLKLKQAAGTLHEEDLAAINESLILQAN